jgi:deazaflavin-dependent oxidoreductase (nitroreductase family)
MPKGHTLFKINNHTANRVVKLILSSPAHGMMSDRLLILTVTGRRSGKKRTFPVAYQQDGDKLTLHIDWPEKKVWWRNLKSPAPVSVRVRGRQRTGTGEAQGDPKSDLWVDVKLDP